MDTPFYLRKFTLDDEPLDIYEFLAVNCDSDHNAYRVLHAEISELRPTFKMCFGGGAVPVRELRRVL